MPDKEEAKLPVELYTGEEIAGGQDIPIQDPIRGITFSYVDANDGWKYFNELRLDSFVLTENGTSVLNIFKELIAAICKRMKVDKRKLIIEILDPMTGIWSKEK